MKYEIIVYEIKNGRLPFNEWLEDLDSPIRYIVRARLDRIKLGNLGIYKSLGQGLNEVKIDLGPGYRLYFSFEGQVIILLLCAGSKRTQQKDIEKARNYLEDYRSRGKNYAKK